MTEKQITTAMTNLNISREEAIQMYNDDARIDRGENLYPLSASQESVSKHARQANRKPTVYKFDTTKRQKKENVGKSHLITIIADALRENNCSVEITNSEREIVIQSEGITYKVVLSQPRK